MLKDWNNLYIRRKKNSHWINNWKTSGVSSARNQHNSPKRRAYQYDNESGGDHTSALANRHMWIMCEMSLLPKWRSALWQSSAHTTTHRDYVRKHIAIRGSALSIIICTGIRLYYGIQSPRGPQSIDVIRNRRIAKSTFVQLTRSRASELTTISNGIQTVS